MFTFLLDSLNVKFSYLLYDHFIFNIFFKKIIANYVELKTTYARENTFSIKKLLFHLK